MYGKLIFMAINWKESNAMPNQVSNQPYISFVVATRNDNYGGDLLHRVNVFLKALLMLSESHSLPCELIIVEWNPPGEREALRDAITWPSISRKYSQVRIIQVSKELHRSLSNPAGLALFEYIGKNVGIRRAKGEYILATNPDVIYNEKLIDYLTARKLSPKCFYRIDRYDVKSPVPFDLSVEAQLDYCARNVIRICGYLRTYENTLKSRLTLRRGWRTYLKNRILHFPFVPAHVNASGDFLLVHRDWWHIARGYPELETQGKPHHIDGLMVNIALASGLKQVILRNPLRVYHQDHGRPDSAKPISKAVAEAYRRVEQEKKLVIFNGEAWGLGAETLPEALF